MLCMGVWWFILCPACLYRHPLAISKVLIFLFLHLICFILSSVLHGKPLICEVTTMKTNKQPFCSGMWLVACWNYDPNTCGSASNLISLIWRQKYERSGENCLMRSYTVCIFHGARRWEEGIQGTPFNINLEKPGLKEIENMIYTKFIPFILSVSDFYCGGSHWRFGRNALETSMSTYITSFLLLTFQPSSSFDLLHWSFQAFLSLTSSLHIFSTYITTQSQSQNTKAFLLNTLWWKHISI